MEATATTMMVHFFEKLPGDNDNHISGSDTETEPLLARIQGLSSLLLKSSCRFIVVFFLLFLFSCCFCFLVVFVLRDRVRCIKVSGRGDDGGNSPDDNHY